MYLVQKNHLRTKAEGYQTLKWLSHKCKNLYNVALYTIKKEYEKTSKYLSESELYHKIKTHPTYQELHSDTAQLTLRTLKQNYKAFFKLLSLLKDNSKEKGKK